MDQTSGIQQKHKTEGTIINAIHEVYDNFSSQEKRVADLVLDSPEELCVYAASELARLASVSNSTITRFVRRTGYTSYDEMRIAAREVRNRGSPVFETSAMVQQCTEDNYGLISEFSEAEVRNLKLALGGLSYVEVKEIALELANARRLVFMGFRSSYFLASYARTQFLNFRDQTMIVPGPGETITQCTSDLGPEDVVVIVGVRCIGGLLKRYMKSMHDRNVRILLITDPSARVVPSYANWTITCPVETPHMFDSYSSVLSVLRLLAYESFKKSGKKGRNYMEKMQAQHEELGEFK